MSARPPSDRHSDLGPSSKDWQTGSPGRDEDFTPDKDRWTMSRKGNLGEGRPGEDVHSSLEGVDSAAASSSGTGDIQPGTQHEGRSWQSRRPRSSDENEQLEEELEDTFPASDPPTVTQPGSTGWDLDEERRSPRRPRSPMRLAQRARTASPGWLWLAVGLALLPVVVSAARAARRPQRRSRPRRP
jgi:hypothetical protein